MAVDLSHNIRIQLKQKELTHSSMMHTHFNYFIHANNIVHYQLSWLPKYCWKKAETVISKTDKLLIFVFEPHPV